MGIVPPRPVLIPGPCAPSPASETRYDNAQLAVDAMGAGQVDVVVVDYLPASYIVEKNSGYECAALYYATMLPSTSPSTAAPTEMARVIRRPVSILSRRPPSPPRSSTPSASPRARTSCSAPSTRCP